MQSDDQISFVYITASDRQEAERIGRQCVSERLAACANVIPAITSYFWWEGKVDQSGEAALILKTASSRLDELKQRVRQLHSYECPCIVAWKIESGDQSFLDWVREVVAPESDRRES